MRLLLDQGLPYSACRHLQSLSWEVLHAVDAGLQRASDQAIIDYAQEQGYYCVTQDADFHSIIAVGNRVKPSVIRIRREGLKGKEIAQLLIDVCSQVSTALEKGALVTVTERSMRIRHLPVQRGS